MCYGHYKATHVLKWVFLKEPVVQIERQRSSTKEIKKFTVMVKYITACTK